VNFPALHCSEVRIVKEPKICQVCGENFFRVRGSETISCCKRLIKQAKKLDVNAWWKEQTTFHLRSMQ
jgi:hypothetical protein